MFCFTIYMSEYDAFLVIQTWIKSIIYIYLFICFYVAATFFLIIYSSHSNATNFQEHYDDDITVL